jgi:esterase/lipase
VSASSSVKEIPWFESSAHVAPIDQEPDQVIEATNGVIYQTIE